MRLAREMLGTFIEADDPILCIGPDWTDVDVQTAWNATGFHDQLPNGTRFDRSVLLKYSARQMRDHTDHDSYWGEDGELQSFVVGATPSRAGSQRGWRVGPVTDGNEVAP